MAIRLRLHDSQSNTPVRVGGVLPGVVDSGPDSLKRMPVWLGNRQVDLGEVFEVTSELVADLDTEEGPERHCWQGDLRCVHEIGAGLQQGRVQIQGDAGRHIGAQMRGGLLEVDGDVSDFLGVEMQGGQIRVMGNAGDWTGAVYPGTRSGMNRGEILVDGNAGAGTGQGMRRGIILIQGTAGPQVGWNMRGGTILVGKGIEGPFGTGMIRGTVITISDSADSLLKNLGPTFRSGGRISLPMIGLMKRWFAKHGRRSESIERLLNSPTYKMFHGDILKGSRGEVLVAES
ncbi:MAG: formylmethanofuran dehydrogenase subunit C [Mariniblastus sp.]|nr:formylmethanofuran dehydrogenase subunit C [Mariniblastus sp.]